LCELETSHPYFFGRVGSGQWKVGFEIGSHREMCLDEPFVVALVLLLLLLFSCLLVAI